MQRPERVVLIGISAIACGIAHYFYGASEKLYLPGISFPIFETMAVFTFPIAIMAVMTNITAVNRLLDVKRALQEKESLTKKYINH